MIQFILNNKLIETDSPSTTILLDFIRGNQHLKGTKIGCREGDCGACTVLVGSLEQEKLVYKTIVSCLTPIGNVIGKHVVTVEGLNVKEMTTVQSAMENNSATQCGFCTPGFVVSITGYALSEQINSVENGLNAISGNICRCTGYKSIERSISEIVNDLNAKPEASSLKWLIEHNYIPAYFLEIPEYLKTIKQTDIQVGNKIIGGGTDLYVQKPDETVDNNAVFFFNNKELKGISVKDGNIILGASVTAGDMMNSEVLNKYFPKIKDWFKLISSEQIRNMGTIGGNIVNASPIGDLSVFFLALNAVLIIKNKVKEKRTVGLKVFFKGYKVMDLADNEYIEKIQFKIPHSGSKFNFEKVSKRTFLDIASVNSAVSYTVSDNLIKDIHISGGGLAPVPVYFFKTSEFLRGKEINMENLLEAYQIMLTEVSPISDIRGSKDYKKLLLKQLFFCHFDI